jgi:hypothetical protein
LKSALVLIGLLCALFPGASIAAAHGDQSPGLIVPVDFIGPGVPFPVIGSDVGSDANVTLSMVTAERIADLGTLTAGPDGHFDTTVVLPNDYPVGPAQLVAASDDGSKATLDLLIGQRRTPLAEQSTQVPWWQDPSMWLLAALVLGAVLVASWAVFRPRAQPQPVAANPRARVPRKPRKH